MFHSSNTRGFTLIELLVVISIIGMLASVVLASMENAKQKSRDGSRRAQLHQIQLALDMYYYSNRTYPPDSRFQPAALTTTMLSDISSYIVPTYISRLPTDPTWGDTANGYRYGTNNTATMYTLLMREEANANNWCEYNSPAGDPGIWTFPAC
jgi:general secretion pathway protein G